MGNEHIISEQGPHEQWQLIEAMCGRNDAHKNSVPRVFHSYNALPVRGQRLLQEPGHRWLQEKYTGLTRTADRLESRLHVQSYQMYTCRYTRTSGYQLSDSTLSFSANSRSVQCIESIYQKEGSTSMFLHNVKWTGQINAVWDSFIPVSKDAKQDNTALHSHWHAHYNKHIQ